MGHAMHIHGGPAPLLPKRPSAIRPSGERSGDDYDVLADDVVVGRIMRAIVAPVGSSWFWTYGYHHDRRPTRRLRSDARGRDGCLRQKLAARMVLASKPI